MDPKTLTLYVSPRGSDQASGLAGQPLSSLTAALKRLRALRLAGLSDIENIVVLVEAGVYACPEPVRFEWEDLGSPDCDIRICRSGPGEAVLVGGIRLDGIEPHDGAVLKVDLGRQNWPHGPVTDLYCNGERLRKARYPKADARNPYGAGWLFVPGEQVNIYQPGFGSPTEFMCADPRPGSWRQIDETEIFVFPRFNWSSDTVPVQSYDAATGRVTLARPCSQAIYPTDRFYFQNVREELTDPGEWYYDKGEQILYFIPPERADERVLTVPTAEHVLVIEGEALPPENLFGGRIDEVDAGGPLALGMNWNTKPLGFVRLEHLTLACSVSAAVLIRHAHGCQITGCTVRNTGGHGIVCLKGRDNRIAGCDIYDTGGMGIYLSGGYRSPHAGFYRGSGHVIENNYIHHVGRKARASSAISANGVGIRIAHNLIHDSSRTGIHTRGNRNQIEYNHIRHVNIETSDAAAINLCDRDLTQHDTKIRYNWIHDVLGLHLVGDRWETCHFTFGIYLDDFTSGVDIHGNLIVRTPRGGVFTHATQDVRVTNNVIVDSSRDLLFVRRWGRGLEYERLGTHGIALTRNAYTGNILASARPDSVVYAVENCMDEDWTIDMKDNVFGRNLFWLAGRPLRVHVSQDVGYDVYDRWYEPFSAWQTLGHDTDSLEADPGFIDPERDDYRLRPDSPAYTLGFEDLPIDRMGPYRSEERASWPIVEASGARETPVVIEHFRPATTI
ncbi:MAG: right-handed parallel beta-helix repeat-containing protein [Clostridiales bacterium]|nr:right-handed parallel beta-helix repeat-containing protein [Clostridiales bacterium]